MYKVFINEKKISLSRYPENADKQILFEGEHCLEVGLHILENTSIQSVNIYGEDIDFIWERFKNIFKIVEGAGGVVKNTEQKILFIRRLGRWDLPKGKIERGETYETAAVREVEEETRLSNVKINHFIMKTYHIYKEREGGKVLKIVHWFDMDYDGSATPIPQVEEGITDVQWLCEEEIIKKVLPNTFRNIQIVLAKK